MAKSTPEEILDSLLQDSAKRWGRERTEELRRALEETADQLWEVYQYPLPPEEEPTFFPQYARRPAGGEIGEAG